MKRIAQLFWPLLPVILLVMTYREATSSVHRYWTLATNPSAAFDTYKDVQGVATTVSIYYRATQRLPRDLETFLNDSRLAAPGRDRPLHVDAWGTPYQLHDLGETYEVVSCGPSTDCAVERDNLVERVRKVSGDLGTGRIRAEEGEGQNAEFFQRLQNIQRSADERLEQLEGAPE
jgi:hypothetical protein